MGLRRVQRESEVCTQSHVQVPIPDQELAPLRAALRCQCWESALIPLSLDVPMLHFWASGML